MNNKPKLTKDEQKKLEFYLNKGLTSRTYTEAKIYRKKAEALLFIGRRR